MTVTRNFFLVCLVCIAFTPLIVSGLKCYACVQSGNEDSKCEKDPKTIQNSVINCNKKYCVTRRIEYVDQAGKVFSFYRGCEQRPEYINEEITDSQFITYYRSCTTDLCNSGNGKESGGGGGGGGGINSDGDDDNGAIMVPGMNAATTNTVTIISVVLAAALPAILLT